jgi:hypothetical protein
MKPPKLSMKPLANHIPIANHDSSNQRIRAHPTPPTLGELKSTL